MPNSYSVAPGTVVGDQVVGGSVIAGSASGLKMRLDDATAQPSLDVNYSLKTSARDVLTQPGFALSINTGTFALEASLIGAAGTLKKAAHCYGIMLNSGNTAFGGDTAEHTVYSSIIPGKLLSLFGQIRLSLVMENTTQGGVSTSLRVKLGATVLKLFGTTTATAKWIELIVANQNNTSIQNVMFTYQENAVANAVGIATAAVDTTLDNTLAITIQSGATTDVEVFRIAQGLILPSGQAV